MTRKIEQVRQWTGYQGNKRKLVPLIMSLIPKHTERFVDLFGGTGIVGANAYRFNRCQKVIYNDLEYDLMKTLAYMNEKPPEFILREQNELIEYCFGNAEKTGVEHKPRWAELISKYNETRRMPWDEKRKEAGYEYGMLEYRLDAPGANGSIRLDRYGDWGDWGLFLFLVRHSFNETPDISDNGRHLKMTLRTDKRPKRDDPKLKDFLTAWHETPVDFYSCDFTTGFLFGKRHERPRPEEQMDRFRDMISSLTEKDFVFIDPPYLGSKAAYNSKWKQAMEIYLMAFCQTLKERRVPFLITNNLAWNDSIFTEWRKQFNCYMIAEGAKKIYENKEANHLEVFVSNKPLPKSKYKVHADLVRLPKGE